MGSIKKYTGISFPFRIGTSGGVAMSSTSPDAVPHIVESIIQILNTSFLERTMESQFYSDIDTQVFEPNNASTQALLEYQIKDALKRLEPRIEVSGIEFESSEDSLFAQISFKVVPYETESYVVKTKVGEFNGSQSTVI